jgi:hypothetical protein
VLYVPHIIRQLKVGLCNGRGATLNRPTSASSTGCSLLLSCGWTSTELIFGFTLVTHSVQNRCHIQVDR